jgi:hypothetical protein
MEGFRRRSVIYEVSLEAFFVNFPLGSDRIIEDVIRLSNDANHGYFATGHYGIAAVNTQLEEKTIRNPIEVPYCNRIYPMRQRIIYPLKAQAGIYGTESNTGIFIIDNTDSFHGV